MICCMLCLQFIQHIIFSFSPSPDNVIFVFRLPQTSKSREKSVVNEIFGGYLRSQGSITFTFVYMDMLH